MSKPTELQKTMDAHVDNGGNPNEMAAVYSIIQNPSPKIHYKVGALIQKIRLS
jgi:hypothetical protein